MTGMTRSGSEAALAGGAGTRHYNQYQLAHRWGISARTLERWRWLGQGPAYLKLGGRVAYRHEDVEAFEATQRRTREMGNER